MMLTFRLLFASSSFGFAGGVRYWCGRDPWRSVDVFGGGAVVPVVFVRVQGELGQVSFTAGLLGFHRNIGRLISSN